MSTGIFLIHTMASVPGVLNKLQICKVGKVGRVGKVGKEDRLRE